MTEILAGYGLPLTGVHGVAHWGRVLETGLRLAAATAADKTVVALFSVFHDARRRNESIDPDHGRRGAELAARLRPLLQISDNQFAQLADACTRHTDGATAGDPTVRTCWDADRLDLWRVGIRPRRSLLCTAAARETGLLEWSRRRSCGAYVPECSRAWLRLVEAG